MVERTKPITHPIKRNKLPLFSRPTAKAVSKKQAQVSALKDDCSLFSRLYISCQTREGDLEEFFRHENQPWPPSSTCPMFARHNWSFSREPESGCEDIWWGCGSTDAASKNSKNIPGVHINSFLEIHTSPVTVMSENRYRVGHLSARQPKDSYLREERLWSPSTYCSNSKNSTKLEEFLARWW